MIDPRKYIFAFLITAIIFGTAIYMSNLLGNKKIEEVRNIQNQVSLDILSTETQFALLEDTSCGNISPTGFLSQELGPLGEKLAYAEYNQGFDKAEVDSLKRSYFLLEIKDYLLMKRLFEKCKIPSTFVLYFYSTEDRCPDCEKMGYVLTALREKYPTLRVYSFDYDYDLEAVRTMERIYKVENKLPALLVNGEPFYGFHTVDELESEVPALRRLATATSSAQTATSTKR